MWIFLSIVLPLFVISIIALCICFILRKKRREHVPNLDSRNGISSRYSGRSTETTSNSTRYKTLGQSSFEQQNIPRYEEPKPSSPIAKTQIDENWSNIRDPSLEIVVESYFTPLTLRFHDAECTKVFKPDELDTEFTSPPGTLSDEIRNRINGSLTGLAVGDALGAPVEFRPYEYLKDNSVKEYIAGGTWGLQKGQFTDDTSMALCLANSLISCGNYDPYNQLVQYKWWYRHGFMSSTAECFDIGAATRVAVEEFIRRQDQYAAINNTPKDSVDELRMKNLKSNFDWKCGQDDAAGNGSLMRLAPVPLFFYRKPSIAVKYSGESSLTTHGDPRARDACRFYGALIVGALQGLTKNDLLDPEFFEKHRDWFGAEDLVPEIKTVAKGSYKKKPRGYEDGIRGAGFVVASLEAALWSFFTDNNSFEKGVLQVINLGDDTDTTAAIYGQLAGAFYGYNAIPKRFVETLYARRFIEKVSGWIDHKGLQWSKSSTD